MDQRKQKKRGGDRDFDLWKSEHWSRVPQAASTIRTQKNGCEWQHTQLAWAQMSHWLQIKCTVYLYDMNLSKGRQCNLALLHKESHIAGGARVDSIDVPSLSCSTTLCS